MDPRQGLSSKDPTFYDDTSYELENIENFQIILSTEERIGERSRLELLPGVTELQHRKNLIKNLR